MCNYRFQSTLGPRMARNTVPCRQCFCEVKQRHPAMAGEHDEELVAYQVYIRVRVICCCFF